MAKTMYLDFNATTPVDPRVVEAMLPYFTEEFGNAASHTHRYGWVASEAVEAARESVAQLIGAEKDEIIFTSGATEAINLALKGIFVKYVNKGKHLIGVDTEHKAVLDTLSELERMGAEITLLPVDREGKVDPQRFREALRPDTVAAAVMLANNETGTIQNIDLLSSAARNNGTIFFSDITQACGKVRVDVNELGVDSACISAHKFGGPKGVGAVYLRRRSPRVAVHPLIHGGGHEKGIRSGTLNVPGIVGMGKAAELVVMEMWDRSAKVSAIRTKAEQLLTDDNRGFINGSIKDRLPNTSSITFPGLRADKLIAALPGFAFSAGSACTSAENTPSHVLMAMGLTEEEARCTVRLSFGTLYSEAEVLEGAAFIRGKVDELRS